MNGLHKRKKVESLQLSTFYVYVSCHTSSLILFMHAKPVKFTPMHVKFMQQWKSTFKHYAKNEFF